MAMVPNGVEKLRKIPIAWAGCTNIADRRQTDGRTTTTFAKNKMFDFSHCSLFANTDQHTCRGESRKGLEGFKPLRIDAVQLKTEGAVGAFYPATSSTSVLQLVYSRLTIKFLSLRTFSFLGDEETDIISATNCSFYSPLPETAAHN